MANGIACHHLQIATIADAIYGVWAKYRLQVTGKHILHLEFCILISEVHSGQKWKTQFSIAKSSLIV